MTPSRRRRKRKRRGYPLTLLIVLQERDAFFWQVFSEAVRSRGKVHLGRKRHDPKRTYHFHEDIVNGIRPLVREGIKSIILIIPPKTDFAQDFINHLHAHHRWLVEQKGRSKLTIGTFEAEIADQDELTELMETDEFQEVINATVSQEGARLVAKINRLANLPEVDFSDTDILLFSLKDIEQCVYAEWAPEDPHPAYIITTDAFLKTHPQKGRVYRLLQIAQNKGVKTRVLELESDAGDRVAEFGGIVAFSG